MAIQTLQILRSLYFISSRLGANAFSQYTFVYLTAIDILLQYPVQTEAFLQDIRPTSAGSIPQHPLDRCHDLYFLNTAEHFTVVLFPELNEHLLIGAATPYLGLGSDPRLLEIFEAAHSVMLAVLSAPQNSNLLARHIHPYVDALFKVFPKTCPLDSSAWLSRRSYVSHRHRRPSPKVSRCCPLRCLSSYVSGWKRPRRSYCSHKRPQMPVLKLLSNHSSQSNRFCC